MNGQRESIANRVPTASGRLESARASFPSHGVSREVIDKHRNYIYTRPDVIYHMYGHRRSHVRTRVRVAACNTFQKRQNKRSGGPQSQPKHTDTKSTRPCTKQAHKDKHKSRPRRVATSNPIDTCERTATGRSGQYGAAPTPSPQPKPCPALKQPPLPRCPPIHTPTCMLGERGATRGTGLCKGREGCWRMPAACKRARAGGLVGLGVGEHTRRKV